MRSALLGVVATAIGMFGAADLVSAEEGLSGTWDGTYTCGGANASMTLEVKDPEAGGFYSGLFRFEMPQGKGSFAVSGRLLPSGQFTFVPQEWIERPTGFSAVTLEGMLNPNGLSIEGRMSPCGQSSFKATREMAGQAREAVSAPPAPLSGGLFAGSWQGAVECRANRQGRVESYPLALSLWQDGDGVGGLAHVRIWKQRGSNGGEAFDELVALSGTVSGATLVLDRALRIDGGGASPSVSLKYLDITAGDDGTFFSTVKMNTCETVSVSRSAAMPQALVLEDIEGMWVGIGGMGNDTILRINTLSTAHGDLIEMRAQWPARNLEAERDRLALMLVPVHRVGDNLVAVPVAARDATGIFSPAAVAQKHLLIRAEALILTPETQRLTVSVGRGINEISEVFTRNGVHYVLARPSDSHTAALDAGETPPVDLGAGISGTLATAESREAQCRVLGAWIEPFANNIDVDRMSLNAVLARLTTAFADDAFKPVFGIPFLLTSDQERRAVALLIRDTCARNMGMKVVGIVGNHILASPTGFTRFATIIANQGETDRWRAEIVAAINALPFDQSGLDRIEGIRREMQQRRTELSTEERRELEGILDRRTAETRAAMLLAEANALPEAGTGPEALGSVFALMNRLEQAGLDGGLVQPVRDVAEAKARAILAGPLVQSAEVAASVPASLEGLRLLMAEWNRLGPARAGMDRHFGSVDRDGVLRPVHQRLEGFWSDPGIKEEFRAAMMAIEAGQDPRASVMNAAALYIDTNRLDHAPGWGAIIEAAILDSEVRALRIVDLSTSPDPGEPTAEEIAAFALDRARAINAEYRQLEERCLSGRVSGPVMALRCLGVPAVITGQRGMAARLLSITKITCETEVAEKQYRCTFIQEIDLAVPGMQNLGLESLVGLARSGTAGEATDARFIRQAGGGWSILWGDLNR